MVKNSHIHGRGVFADTFYKKGDIIYEVPILIIKSDNVSGDVIKYCFPWSGKNRECCIVLGEPTLMNSSNDPNCRVSVINKTKLTKTFIAIKDITIGEEITLQYMKEHKI